MYLTRIFLYFKYPNMRADHNMPSIILKRQNLFVTHLSHTVYKVYQKNLIVSYTFAAKLEMSFKLFDFSLVGQNYEVGTYLGVNLRFPSPLWKWLVCLMV